MTTSVITALENSLQKTNSWIHEIAELADCDAQQAYHGLRATLHALRDRISTKEAADLASQLPLVIRGIFYENWRPNQVAKYNGSREEFLKEIYDAFQNDLEVDPERMVRSVFAIISRHVTKGEVQDVRDSLPVALQEWWC